MDDESLYDRIGGEYRINSMVDSLYEKVLRDDGLNYFFEEISMDSQISKLKSFLKVAFGAGSISDGAALRAVHSPYVERGLSDVHMNSLIRYMSEVLQEQGLGGGIIGEVEAVLNGYRADVLCQ